MSALMAGAAPGTKVGFAPTIELNRSPQVNPIEPTPACPMFSFWAFAFTYEMNSWRSLAGKSLLATIITGAQPDKPIRCKVNIRFVSSSHRGRNSNYQCNSSNGTRNPRDTNYDWVSSF